MAKREEWLKRTDRGWFAHPAVCYRGPNARTVFDREKLDTLKAQVRQDGVQIQLIVRRKKNDDGGELEIWDGGRRFIVVEELIAEGSPIEWIPVSIQRKSDAEMMIAAAMTHAGKEPLDPVDEANMVSMLIAYGLKAEEVGTRLGWSVATVHRRRQLSQLEPPSRGALRDGKITIGRAMELAKFTGQEQINRLPKEKMPKEGAQAKRPGKRLARELVTMLKNGWEPPNGLEPIDALVSVLEWMAGGVPTEELHKVLGVNQHPVKPAAPKVP